MVCDSNPFFLVALINKKATKTDLNRRLKIGIAAAGIIHLLALAGLFLFKSSYCGWGGSEPDSFQKSSAADCNQYGIVDGKKSRCRMGGGL